MSEPAAISPIWRYLPKDYTEKEVNSVHLLLWQGGITAAGYNQSGEIKIAQTYLSQTNPDLIWLKEIINQDELLKNHAKRVKKIWLSESRNLLIPNSIYEANYAESWIRKFHFLSTDETLLHFELNENIDARIVFPISQEVKICLLETFPKASFSSVSKMAFQPIEKMDPAAIQMICLPREVTLTLGHNGHFIYHSVFPYNITQDIIYKLALILEEKEIDQEQVAFIKFSGIAPFWNNILDEIPPYFPVKVASANTTEITLNFLEKLFQCV